MILFSYNETVPYCLTSLSRDTFASRDFVKTYRTVVNQYVQCVPFREVIGTDDQITFAV